MVDLSFTEIERATSLAWPALEEITDGSWVARFARGYTKRANSIHAFDPADTDNAGSRIDAMAALYGARYLHPTFRVTPLTGAGIVEALDAKGWDVYEQSLVLAMDLTKRMRPVAATTRLFEANDPEWRALQGRMAGYDAEAMENLAGILGKLAMPARGIVVYDDTAHPSGAALAVNANGIAIFLNVVVDPDRRGMGYGRAVMHAALNWTAQAGATKAAIQVLADNAQAVPLYHSLGFTDAYGYHYRRAPR